MAFGHLQSSTAPVMLVDAAQQRGFMLLNGSTLRVYDLRTRMTLKDMTTPQQVSTGRDGGGAPALDVAHHRIFFSGGVGDVCANPPTFPGLAVLDTAKLSWSTLNLACGPDQNVFNVESTHYNASDDTLYLFGYDGAFAVTYGFSGAPMTVKAVKASDGSQLWQVALPGCNRGDEVNGVPDASVALFRYQDQLAVECAELSSNPTGGQDFQSLMVTLPLRADGSPVTDAAGNPQTSRTITLGSGLGIISDPKGSLVLFTSSLQAYGYGVYVFDVARHVFRGAVATGGGNEFASKDLPRFFGFDASLGRVYLRNERGLISADVRHQPLPGGLLYADLADTYNYANGAPRPYGDISVDDQNHLVYIPDYSTNRFLIYQDNVPTTPNVALPNPDQATSDVAEIQGKTQSNYTGAANGFGMYLLSEGGLNRVVEGSTSTCCTMDQYLTPGDRDWFLGRVAQASLTNNGANAEAAPVEFADSATDQDLANPKCAPPGTLPAAQCAPSVTGDGGLAGQLKGAGITWPAQVASCQDFGGSKSSHGVVSHVGVARVSCDQAGAVVHADASYAMSSSLQNLPSGVPPLPVLVGSFESHITTVRDPQAGETTTVDSYARNVSIPLPGASPISIGEIHTKATSAAHGRPRTASATFSRVIDNFVSPTYACVVCDPAQVVDALNTAFQQGSVLAAAFANPPDPSYYPAGSPGGYQALVTKDAATRTSEAAVDDDPTDTAVGLEVIYYTDNAAGRSRQVLQFAGVHAESHYGVFALDSTVFPTPAPTPDVTLPPALGAVAIAPAPPPGKLAPAPTGAKNPRSRTVLEAIYGDLRDIWTLLVSDPKHALELAALWALLLFPIYLGLRRRSMLRTLSNKA